VGNMKKRLLRRAVALALCVYTVLAATGCGAPPASEQKYAVEVAPGELVIANLDMGKADACVIRTADRTVVIDTGTEEKRDVLDACLRQNGIRIIDCLILTHIDKDHAGNAEYLLENYHVGQVAVPVYESEEKELKSLRETLRESERTVIIRSLFTCTMDNITMEILGEEKEDAFPKKDASYENNMSLVVTLCFGDKKFLFTGDIEKERMQRLRMNDQIPQADWIKIPHHGAYDKEEQKLLWKVEPSYAVISTGDGSEPEKKLLELLRSNGIRYMTTENGYVLTRTDGKTITMEQPTLKG